MCSLAEQPRTASQLRSILVGGFLAICILPGLASSTALNASDTGHLAMPKSYHSPTRAVWPSNADSQPKLDTNCGADRVSHPETGKCLPKVIYHEKCAHTLQCVTKEAICAFSSVNERQHAVCRCPKYWTPSENRIVCIRRSECTSGPELPGCLASNQFCEVKSNLCACNPGFTLDEWASCYLSGEKPQTQTLDDDDEDTDEAQLVTITNQVNSTTSSLNFTIPFENLTRKSTLNVTESSSAVTIDDRNSPSGQIKDSFVQKVAIGMCLFFLAVFLVVVCICTLKNGSCCTGCQRKVVSLKMVHYRKVVTGDPPPREAAQEAETTHFMSNQ